MAYYEIIIDNEFIGIATSADMIRFQEKHNIILNCDETKAEYVMCNDKLYHADWMLSVNAKSTVEYTIATVVTIDEETYNSLYSAIENNEEIEIEQDDGSADDSQVYEEGEEVTLEYVMNSKINEMNNTCNAVITSGFDIVLSDGETYHYSLTVQDQLNLITLSSMVASGETVIPYHADGELCRGYSAEDITLIINAATQFKTYHITYYNSLKVYIASMDDIQEISNAQYGIEIPEEYQSDVLKALIAQSGS